MPVSKGPLNYTTTIEATKSASECIARLAQHGASAIGITYELAKPTGLSFVIDTPYGPRTYALPVNARGTHKALQEAYRRGRVSRRFHLYDFDERQLDDNVRLPDRPQRLQWPGFCAKIGTDALHGP